MMRDFPWLTLVLTMIVYFSVKIGFGLAPPWWVPLLIGAAVGGNAHKIEPHLRRSR